MTTATEDTTGNSRFGGARDAVSGAFGSVRERTSGFAQRATDGVNDNPVPFLLGGLALGAVAGVLLPKTAKEAELFGPIGSRVSDAARAAFDAAKQTGGDSLGDFRLNAENARSQATKLFGDVAKAASQAGTSAFRGQGQSGGGQSGQGSSGI